MVVAALVALSVSSLSGMEEWPRIHWIRVDDDVDLMKFRIEEVHGFNEMRASHNDLLPVQKSMGIEGWLALMNFQDNAYLMAVASSS